MPPVVLTAVSKVGSPAPLVAGAGGIALSWRDAGFDVEIAAFDFTAPAENRYRYRYRLEGAAGGWVELGNRRRVTFAHLDPGRYVLRFQGSNNDGVWSSAGLSLPVTVAPPWWLTRWATGLWVLAAAALAGLERLGTRKLARGRAIARRERAQAREKAALVAELEAKNAELERFNYTVSHDLKSPLVTIKGFLGLLEKDALSGRVERLPHSVRRIGAAADRMSRPLDELLELSRLGRQARPPELVALAEVVREALEQIRGHAGERAVEVVIDERLPVVRATGCGCGCGCGCGSSTGTC